MTQEKGKNIFEAALNAVSNRDEKAAIEAAMKRGQELERQLMESEKKAAGTAQKLAASESQLAAMKKELDETEKELVTARTSNSALQSRVSQSEMKLIAVTTELQKYVSADQAEKIAQAAADAERAKIITEHTLKTDETLSHLALKYYHNGYEPYWRVIYEANKELIGPNPGRVRPGMVIKIPVLPEELKK